MHKSQTSKRGSLIVRTVIVSSKGDAVKVTKVQLSKEGSEMLRSESQGIRLKRDHDADVQEQAPQAVAA